MSEEVQRHPLGREQAPRAALYGREDRSVANSRAVGLLDLELEGGVYERKSAFGRNQPCDRSSPARYQPRARSRIRRHHKVGREIARPTEILLQRMPNRRLDEETMRRPREGESRSVVQRATLLAVGAARSPCM